MKTTNSPPTDKQLCSFWSKVIRDEQDLCWEWSGTKVSSGYGRFWYNGKMVGAHRFVYFVTVGHWPKVCRHRCDNPCCVNPFHLENGTQADNMKDSVDRGRNPNKNKTHCANGHQFTDNNTATRGRNGRLCKECNRNRALAAYYRKKEGNPQ